MKKVLLSLVFFFVFINIGHAQTSTNLSYGNFGCYNLEGSNGTDYSPFGYDLTINGTIDTGSGHVKSASEFDGTSYEFMYNISLASRLNSITKYSIAVWFKSDVTSTNKGFIKGKDSSQTADEQFMARYDSDTGGTLTWAHDGGSGDNMRIESSTGIQDTGWNLMVVTWDTTQNGGVPYMWLNNTNNTLSVSDGSVQSTTGHNLFYVGIGSKEATAGSWNGQVDSLMLWNYSLNTSQIDDLWNSGSGRSCEDIYGVTAEGGGGDPTPAGDFADDLQINLTFDENLTKDYSLNNLLFEIQGTANQISGDTCKWYGCANFSASSGDYINSSFTTSWDSGISVSWWINYISSPSTTSHGMWRFGKNSAYQSYCEESIFGLNCHYDALNGEVSGVPGEDYIPNVDTWTHYFVIYNETTHRIYQNGVLIDTENDAFGNLNYSNPMDILVGISPSYSADMYMDEFLMWNRSDFTLTNVTTLYNQKRLGTPPEIDLFVSNVTYNMLDHINWSHQYNYITNFSGTMPINITLKNSGTNTTNTFSYNLSLEGTNICSGTTTLSPFASLDITCNWTKAEGIHKGYVIIDSGLDITEDDETNNNLTVYIPFIKDRTYFTRFIDQDQWLGEYDDYCTNASNLVAESSCNRYDSSTADDWNTGWGANDIDPRGKQGRQNSVNCMKNNYSFSIEACNRSLNYLGGWASFDGTEYTSVQAIHELAQLGFQFNLMFPMLNKDNVTYLAAQYHDICNDVFELISPYSDTVDAIASDNGKGFGSGMAEMCYSILGLYPNNPNQYSELEDQTWQYWIPDEWMDREDGFLLGVKNDSHAKYDEGWHYKFYSQYHLVENLLQRDKLNLTDNSFYQNAMCSMGNEFITDLLDHNHYGFDYLGQGKQNLSGVQRGDSYTYTDISSGSILAGSIVTYYGLLCDDQTIKNELLWMREFIFNESGNNGVIDVNSFNIIDTYLEKQLNDQATKTSPRDTHPRIIFDNANDIFTIRSDYTYLNDTVIQIDGGEERGTGHSQAQGFYLYALGTPFIDYEQVPSSAFSNNDDVRSEVHKNTVAFYNQTNAQGDFDTYSQSWNNAIFNQYYGMLDAPEKTLADYPDFRYMQLNATGDVEDYIGTNDTEFAGAYIYRPMFNTTGDIEESFIKFGDLMVKRLRVPDSETGEIYDTSMSMNVFDYVTWGLNLTQTTLNLSRNATLVQQVVWSNESLILGLAQRWNACTSKTTCSGNTLLSVNYTKFYHYVAKNSLDMIKSYTWFDLNGAYQTVNKIDNADKGVSQGNNNIVYDTDEDGFSTSGTINATGWGMVYDSTNKKYGAFNSTSFYTGSYELVSSNDTFEYFVDVDTDKITLSINSMKRANWIDYPVVVEVSIDGQEMTNTSNFTVTKDSVEISSTEIGSVVTFDVIGSQTTSTYIITAGDTPAGVSDSCTCPNVNNNWQLNLTDGCFIQTDCHLGIGNISFIESGSISFNATINVTRIGSLNASGTSTQSLGYIYPNTLILQRG